MINYSMAEIINERTLDGKVFDTGKKQGSKPVKALKLQNGLHYKKGNVFEECSNVLESREVNGRSHFNTHNRCGEVSFTDYSKASKQALTVKQPSGVGITLRYIDKQTYGPFTDSIRSIRYDTGNGVTINQVANYKGANIILTLTNKSTNRFKFSIEEHGKFTYSKEGSKIVCTDESGEKIYIKALYVKDRNNNYGTLSIDLGPIENGEQTIIKTIDNEWLQNAVLPVSLDPDVTIDDTTGTIIDTWYRIDFPDDSGGASQTLFLSRAAGVQRYNSSFKVDLSSYSGITVVSAKWLLDFYAGSASAPIAWRNYLKEFVDGTTSSPALAGESTWTYQYYNTTAWATAGALGFGTDVSSGTEGTATITVPDSAAELPMTAATVQDWIDTPANNHGNLVYPTSDIFVQIYSTESVAGNPPSFYMEYTEGSGFPFFFGDEY